MAQNEDFRFSNHTVTIFEHLRLHDDPQERTAETIASTHDLTLRTVRYGLNTMFAIDYVNRDRFDNGRAKLLYTFSPTELGERVFRDFVTSQLDFYLEIATRLDDPR